MTAAAVEYAKDYRAKMVPVIVMIIIHAALTLAKTIYAFMCLIRARISLAIVKLMAILAL